MVSPGKGSTRMVLFSLFFSTSMLVYLRNPTELQRLNQRFAIPRGGWRLGLHLQIWQVWSSLGWPTGEPFVLRPVGTCWNLKTAWWLGTFFPYIYIYDNPNWLWRIHIFQRGWNHQYQEKYAFEEKTMCVSETQLKDLEKNASVRAGAFRILWNSTRDDDPNWLIPVLEWAITPNTCRVFSSRIPHGWSHHRIAAFASWWPQWRSLVTLNHRNYSSICLP